MVSAKVKLEINGQCKGQLSLESRATHLIGRPGVNTTCDWSAVRAPAGDYPRVRYVTTIVTTGKSFKS